MPKWIRLTHSQIPHPSAIHLSVFVVSRPSLLTTRPHLVTNDRLHLCSKLIAYNQSRNLGSPRRPTAEAYEVRPPDLRWGRTGPESNMLDWYAI